MNHNWYAVITAKVLMAKDISSTQKLLLALISNLSNERGYCFASNAYLGECLDISPERVSANISNLEKTGYLGRIILRNSVNEVESRILTIIEKNGDLPTKTSTPPHEKMGTPPHENVKDNNKVFNNKDNRENTPPLFYKPEFKREPIIPELQKVKEVFIRNGGTDEMAISFFNKWEASGWYDGVRAITNFDPMVYNFIQNWNKFQKKNNYDNNQNSDMAEIGQKIRDEAAQKTLNAINGFNKH